MPFDLMQYVDEEIEESSGGGSFICQFSLGAGYLVYATGDRAARYFEVNQNTDREGQKLLATEMAAKTGVDAKGNPKRANFVFTVYLYANSVLNRTETPSWKQAGPGVWGHDLAVWGSAYKDVVRPSVTATLGDDFEPYTKYWGQIDLVPDPYNVKSGKDNRVPQIIRVFASEEEARKAVEAGGGTVARRLPDKPKDFNEDVLGEWSIFAKDVIDSLEGGGDGMAFLAGKEFGFSIVELNLLKKYSEETDKKDVEPDIAF